jgi:hypothetical protein
MPPEALDVLWERFRSALDPLRTAGKLGVVLFQLAPWFVDDYRFGHISVGGQDYDADLILFPDHVQPGWWCREGHRLAPEDVETDLADAPQVLVIGTGYYGRMRVPDETLAALRAAGVDAQISKTGDAVGDFNRLQHECARVVAALHLTC